jgi:tetratricopeptide (TPR) repeat protein
MEHRAGKAFRMLWATLLVFSLSCPSRLTGQDRFEWNDRMQRAWESVTCMRMAEAMAWNAAEKAEHPYNLAPLMVDSYADLLKLYFGELRAEYPRFRDDQEARLERIEEAGVASPYSRFSQGLLHFHGALAAIRFDDKWNAALETRKAYLHLRENQEKYPQFGPNKVYFGVLTAMLGAVPAGYQWILNLFGFRGDIRKGTRMLLDHLEGRTQSAQVCRSEALILYPYLVSVLEGDPAKAIRHIERGGIDPVRNHLHAFMAMNILINNQRSEAALRIIEGMDRSADYLPIPFWHFEKGHIFLNLFRLREAQAEYTRFVSEFKGEYYVRDAYEKLSWIALLQNDPKRAAEMRALVLKRGTDVSDADRSATGNARSGQWPHPTLLKARLLSDGGLQAQAWETLQSADSRSFRTKAERVEYGYRMGRTLDLLGRKDEALRHYAATIEQGAGMREYFAARAALQAGLIHEERRDCEKASSLFTKCLEMTGHEYKNSLDQKAKAGLQRCQGR